MSELVNASNNFMSRLADDLSNSDTSLSLDNISGLPNSPFLLTLNNGKENMEIVKVIDVDVATNIFFIQRGQEGTTAQEHETGSIVENNFTAGTYQALVDEIKNIKENAVFVVEQGENQYGRYVRYSDGKQECWFIDPDRTDVNEESGGIYFSNKAFTFPKEFISTPSVSHFSIRSTWTQWSGIRALTNEMIDIYILSADSRARGYLGYHAIGSWK